MGLQLALAFAQDLFIGLHLRQEPSQVRGFLRRHPAAGVEVDRLFGHGGCASARQSGNKGELTAMNRTARPSDDVGPVLPDHQDGRDAVMHRNTAT